MISDDNLPAVPQLLLASSSPRRQALLNQLGVQFELIENAYQECHQPGESARCYVKRNALAKANAAFSQLPQKPRSVVVLAADTVVALDQHILEKPQHQMDADRMLSMLAGQTHQVLSAVAMVSDQKQKVVLQQSQVTMREISAVERKAYWLSGELQDKAGGYAIQGLGAIFVTHLAGSYSGVMGLPIYETVELLAEFGIQTL